MKNLFRLLGTMALVLTLAMLPACPCSAQCTPTLPQGVLAVDSQSQAQNPDGRSWECAFPTIQEAIDEASAGDQVWVKATTYRLTSAGTTFALKDGVWLLGGFAGTETLRTQADPYANPTILSGDVSDDDDPEVPDTWDDNAVHVVVSDDPLIVDFEHQTRLDGFIIEGGNAVGEVTFHDEFGGGLLVTASSPTNFLDLIVTRCRFRENHAAISGGAAAVNAATDGFQQTGLTVHFINCEFTDNDAATRGGGGVWVYGAHAEITNSLFVGNTSSGDGGGIFLALTCPAFNECNIVSCALPGSVAK